MIFLDFLYLFFIIHIARISFLLLCPMIRIFFYKLNDNRCQRNEKDDSHNTEKLPSNHGSNQSIKGRKPYRSPYHPWIDKLIFNKLHRQIYNQTPDHSRRSNQQGEKCTDSTGNQGAYIGNDGAYPPDCRKAAGTV